MVRRALVALLLSLALPAGAQEAPPADGQTEDDEANAEAIALGEQALEEYGHRRYAAAYVLFERAERRAHTPVFVLYMARCQRELGRLRDARALLRRVAAEPLAEGAPGAFRDAKADAARELVEVEALVPSLRVVVDGASADLALTIDGDSAAVGEAVELDPGAHVATLRRGDAIVAEKRLVLAAGDGVVVASLSVAAEPAPLKAPPPPDPGLSAMTIAGASLVAIGGAAAIGGIVTGALALDTAADVKAQCQDTDCSRADPVLRDESLRLAAASTALFCVAGATAITGTILLIVGMDDDAAVTPEVGLGHLRWRF